MLLLTWQRQCHFYRQVGRARSLAQRCTAAEDAQLKAELTKHLRVSRSALRAATRDDEAPLLRCTPEDNAVRG